MLRRAKLLRPAVGSRVVARFLSSSAFSHLQWPGANVGIEKATTPPSSWYKDPTFYEKVEKEHTFRRWLQVGRSDSLKEVGDYVALTIMGQPIIVTKTEEGFRAYYNVCRHHAARICDDGPGHLGPKGRFTCPYHGWQYNIDGKLTKAVKMKGCEDFSPKNFGLHSLPIQVVGPWIYVNFHPSKNQDIHQDLPDLQKLTSRLDATRYNDLVFIESRRYVLNCNWKVFIDNYLDGGYHVPVAHKGLSANLNLDHYTRVGFDNFYLQTCPTQKPSSTATTQHAEGDLAVDRVSGGEHGNEALYIFQYPNICINRYGQWMDTNIVWPLGPNKCEVVFDWFIHPSLLHDKGMIAESIKQSDIVQQEDIWLCDRVQSGIESWGYDVGRYAPTLEGGEYLFHQKLYQDLMNSSLVAEQK